MFFFFSLQLPPKQKAKDIRVETVSGLCEKLILQTCWSHANIWKVKAVTASSFLTFAAYIQRQISDM